MTDVRDLLEEYRGRREALAAGKIASHPALVRFASRMSYEGGADVAGWA